MDTKPAAIYCRTSVAGQDSLLDAQEAACRQYAAEHGYHVAGVYRDTATGAIQERPALLALREAIDRGEVQAIIARDASRLGRNAVAVVACLEHTQRAGVRVLFVEAG